MHSLTGVLPSALQECTTVEFRSEPRSNRDARAFFQVRIFKKGAKIGDYSLVSLHESGHKLVWGEKQAGCVCSLPQRGLMRKHTSKEETISKEEQ